MERKGITRILTGMLFLSPLISDAWRYGTYIKEFRGNWPKNTDYKGDVVVTFTDSKAPEDVLEGVASEELNNAGFQKIKDYTHDKDKEYWKVKDISLEMLKQFGLSKAKALAKGPTYECMRNPMVLCIPKDKKFEECVKKVYFYDPTDTGTSAFQTVKYTKHEKEDADPPEEFVEYDYQFYALLAPTLYCSMDYSKIVPVDDGKPEAFYEEGEFDDTKTKRETQCFNVRGDAQLFIDFGTKEEKWTEAGDAPIQVHCAMIVYQMPKDPQDGKKWWLHTGPAIFGPELDTLKPDVGDCIPRQYTAIIEQMNGVEILTAGNATKLETSAVAFGLGEDPNDGHPRIGFLSDYCSTIDGEDNSANYDYHNIEVTAEHGATIRTRVLSKDKDGNNIAFDTFHVILPHATGLALQKEMFMNTDRLALNKPEDELAAVVDVLKAVKDISVPEKFGFAIKCVEKFRDSGIFSFDDVPGDDEKKDEEKKDDKKKDDGGEDKSFEDQVKDALAKFRKETAGFEDAAAKIKLDTIKSVDALKTNVEDVNKAALNIISDDMQGKLEAYVSCQVLLKGYLDATEEMLKGVKLKNLQKNLGKLGIEKIEPKKTAKPHKENKKNKKKEEKIWTEAELPGKYAAIKTEYDEFLNNIPDPNFKAEAQKIDWKVTVGGTLESLDDLRKKAETTAEGKEAVKVDVEKFQKKFDAYYNCYISMFFVENTPPEPVPPKDAKVEPAKTAKQNNLEQLQKNLNALKKLLGIAVTDDTDDDEEEHHEDTEEHHDDAKMKMVFGSNHEWSKEDINKNAELVFNELNRIRADGKYKDLKDAIDRVVPAEDKAENLFTVVNFLGSEELKKQLKAFYAGWYLLNEVRNYAEKDNVNDACGNLGTAQVALHVLQVSLNEIKADASLTGENLAKQTEYRTKLDDYNKAIKALEDDEALKTIPDTLTEEWKAFNGAIYKCKCQTTVLKLLIDGMNVGNMGGLYNICAQIDTYTNGIIDPDKGDKTYLQAAQDALAALKQAYQDLIDGIAADITNLQTEVNGKLGEIKDLVADWTQAEKDILATLGNDVGNQLKAKLYKLYHEAIKAAETAKDTNVGEAQKKLDEAKQYYGAIQALIKDVKDGSCDFRLLTGAWATNNPVTGTEWTTNDVYAGIKAVAAAWDALLVLVPEIQHVFTGKDKAVKIGDILNGDPSKGVAGILPYATKVFAILNRKDLKPERRKIVLTCSVGVERLIDAKFRTQKDGENPDAFLMTLRRKLGLSQNALLQLINPDAITNNPLKGGQIDHQNKFKDKYKAFDKEIGGLMSKAGSMKDWKQALTQKFISAMRTRYALEVLSAGMTEKNSGQKNDYSMVAQGYALSDLLTSQMNAVKTQLNQDQADKLQANIEAAKKEMEDFANDLKDYEDFAKVFGEINWDGDNVAEKITAQAGGNDELKKQLELYQQYLAALKSAEEKKDTPDEAQKELDKAKQHLTDLKNQLAASYFPKGNPNGDWTPKQTEYYDAERKYYENQLKEIAKIKEASATAKASSLLATSYDDKLRQTEELLESFRKLLVQLGHMDSNAFGASKDQGQWKVVSDNKPGLDPTQPLKKEFLLNNEQKKEIETFKAKSTQLRNDMQTLKDEIAKWIEEGNKRSVDIKANGQTFNNNLKTVDRHFEDVYNYENIYQNFKSAIESCQTEAQTALDSARQAFESAQKAAGLSKEIQDQYNECNALHIELMTKQSELASKIAKIVIDESWAGKDEVKTKQEEAKKALDEYNTRLTELQTALNSALDESDQKAALTKVKQDLENAQKELNENINKAINDFEADVSEAKEKAQKAAERAQIPQELAEKNKNLQKKLQKLISKLRDDIGKQYSIVISITLDIYIRIFSDPTKSVQDWLQDQQFFALCKRFNEEYGKLCDKIGELKELTVPAPSSSQSHSNSQQQSPQTSSSSKKNQTSVSAPTSPSRGRGKVAPGRYTLRESQAVLSGKRQSIHEISPRRPSSPKRLSRRRQA